MITFCLGLFVLLKVFELMNPLIRVYMLSDTVSEGAE